MDLRNLCSKLDVDAIRAKIPPLPNLGDHIKLPKSMSKLKSRKIFRSSRDDVNSVGRHSSSKSKHPNESVPLPLGPPYAIPPSVLINRTPTRISTISSLMNQSGGSSNKTSRKEGENSYYSAGGIDDYYPSPLSQRFEPRFSRPISPIKAPAIPLEYERQSEQNIKMSFAERVQKGYKDVSSFRLKHLFSKKIVVRRDNIEVDQYVDRFNEERQREERAQEKIDRDIADNYRFQFKESQQNSDESYGSSPICSSANKETRKNPLKSLSELSGDESGMESSPPRRKPGVAASRFSKVRSPPLKMPLEEDSDYDVNKSIELDDEIEESFKPKPNTSTVYEIRKQKSPEPSHQSPQNVINCKERMSRFRKDKSVCEETKRGSEKKRRAPLSPQQSEEQESVSTPNQPEKPLDVIKHNFKRLQKSLKFPQQNVGQSGTDSEIDDANEDTKPKLTKSQQITERLKRFRSVENMDKNQGEENKVQESPMHRITQKLVEWKNSIKKKPQESRNSENDDEDEVGQKRDQPVGSLMKKLKHIRSRKHASTDDPDDDEEGGDTYKESLSARAKLQLEKGVVAATLVPQRTIKKISETKKYFRKKQVHGNKPKFDKTKSDDEKEEDDEVKKQTETITKVPPPISRPYYRDTSEEEDDDDNGEENYDKQITIESNKIAIPTARAAWTTKPILSDDTTDYDDELPRVLIHQDNSDTFESTLIIAVTRPRSYTTTPIITELPPDSSEDPSATDRSPCNWITNEITPPLQRKVFKESKAHSRQHSTDSSSDDSWIKDVPRDVSTALGIKSLQKMEAPWKVKSGKDDETLYKTKSIDIFEFHNKNGGVLTAFEDFDDQLKFTPVVKIEESKLVEIHLNTDSFERDSSEELDYPDDDNSSRVTKISVPPSHNITEAPQNLEPQLKTLPYGNSSESLMANFDDNNIIASGEGEENEDSDDEDDYDNYDEDRPPSTAPSPPPLISLPPPPLPQRQPSLRLSKVCQSSLDYSCPTLPPPPLPLTKPPIPPNRPTAPPQPIIPNRTPSISHISKPLVKTSSLRLAYSEQVKPQDVGKVNKLITRFETDGGHKQRPMIIPRKPYMTSESEEYSANEDEECNVNDFIRQDNRDRTPTNQPQMQKSFSIESANAPQYNNNTSTNGEKPTLSTKATSQIILDNSTSVMGIPSISISASCQDFNSNLSQPNSEYGSPLTYPSSLVGSAEVTPLTSRREADFLITRRSRRSLQRDDDNFYSFDSDEENSYYSISSTGSNRYVVEL